MSACPDRVAALLEASPDDLAGRTDAEISRHVVACEACRAAVATLLRATDSLDRALASPGAGGPDVDALLARARHPERSGVRRHRAFARPRWVGLAAAASLAALLLVGRDRIPAPVAPVPAPISRPIPTVESADNANVAVLQTDNPDITVLWFF